MDILEKRLQNLISNSFFPDEFDLDSPLLKECVSLDSPMILRSQPSKSARLLEEK